ncbi:MAG: hypothetical protein R3E08_11390 [Thiotrichaceae bacterium]
MHTSQLRYSLSFILLLLATVGLYWAGLSGAFLLDDEPNLMPLQYIHDAQRGQACCNI